MVEAMHEFGTDRIVSGRNGIAEVFVRFDPTGQRIIEFGSTHDSAAFRESHNPDLSSKMIIYDDKSGL